MADTAISTGAKHDSDLRRRNVPDTARPQAPVPYTAEDVKKQKPQVGIDNRPNPLKLLIGGLGLVHFFPSSTSGLGANPGPHHPDSSCPLYSTLPHWSFRHCDLG